MFWVVVWYVDTALEAESADRWYAATSVGLTPAFEPPQADRASRVARANWIFMCCYTSKAAGVRRLAGEQPPCRDAPGPPSARFTVRAAATVRCGTLEPYQLVHLACPQARKLRQGLGGM